MPQKECKGGLDVFCEVTIYSLTNPQKLYKKIKGLNPFIFIY